MRYIKRILIAIIIASTIFLNASLGRESAEESDDDVPPDLLTPALEMPLLADARLAIAVDTAAKYKRLAAEEKARLLAEETARLDALEAERLRKLTESAVAVKSTPIPSRSSDYVGQAQTYEATAYTAKCVGCSGITKTGVDIRNSIYHEGRRVIATDPGYITLGSIVRITLANGSSFEAISEDIGSAIKGTRIDIAHETKAQAYEFGRQSVEVRVVRKGR